MMTQPQGERKMDEQNLSQWFDLAEQKPWEVGVYEVQSKHLPKELGMYSFFDGHVFRYIKRDANSAFNYRADTTYAEIVRWRGLSTNPEVKKKPQNNRKTMYVVIDRGGVVDTPVAAFFDAKNAQEYSERLAYPRIKRIRFRTPE